MNYKKNIKTIDVVVSNLCNEIDQWKEETEYWRDKYEKEAERNNKMVNESLESAKNGIANALVFALNVEDNENGDMVIKKENRNKIAKQFKKK